MVLLHYRVRCKSLFIHSCFFPIDIFIVKALKSLSVYNSSIEMEKRGQLRWPKSGHMCRSQDVCFGVCLRCTSVLSDLEFLSLPKFVWKKGFLGDC